MLIDLQMPACPGDRLGRIIRGDPGLRGIPLMLMTDLRRAAHTSDWQEKGFAGRVTKPVKQGELGGTLASVLGYGPSSVQTPSAPAPRPIQIAARGRRRLLLVEDNAVNQEVATGILENLGYPVDVAGDGRSALALLARNRYAAVLTDCDLPELDGYELTRLIRSPETDVIDHGVPVIAMTAHALAGDREKCLLAGMEDYVSKPVNPHLFEAVLDRCTGVDGNSPHPQHQPADTSPVKAATFDREELFDRVMGNEDLARRVVDRFVTDMPNQLVALSAAIDGVDKERTHAIAHSIKGAAANVSGVALSHAASVVEAAARDGDMSRAREAMPQLRGEFEQAAAAFTDFLASL